MCRASADHSGPYCYRSAPPWAGAVRLGRSTAACRPAPSPPCRRHPLLPRSLAPSPIAPPRYTSGSRGRAGALRVRLRCWSTRSRGQTEKSQSLPARFDPHSLCPLFALPPAHLPRSASLLSSALALFRRTHLAEAALHCTPPSRTASPAPPRSRHRTGRIARPTTSPRPSFRPGAALPHWCCVTAAVLLGSLRMLGWVGVHSRCLSEPKQFFLGK
jgi:hypothetical protein